MLAVMDPDAELLHRLRAGDERAFVVLVGRYHEPMLRLAASFVPSAAVAEEVVQDTWLAVLRGLERLRGPLVAEDLAVPHPGQPGPHHGHAGAAQRAGRRSRARGRPGRGSAPPGHWSDPPEHWIEAAEARLDAGQAGRPYPGLAR